MEMCYLKISISHHKTLVTFRHSRLSQRYF